MTPPEETPSAKKNRRKVFLVTLFIFAIFSLGAISGWFLQDLSRSWQKIEEPPESQPQPLLIGGIAPLTGDAASYGIPIQQAAFLAQKEINEAGGVNGRPLEMIWEDGKCENKDARTAAEKLVTLKKVDFLIAGICSSEFLVAAPIAQAKRIISFSPSATSQKISQLGKYVFRSCPSDALAGRAAAEYAYHKLGARTAVIVTENKDYTLGLRDVFKSNFTGLGGQILTDEIFGTGTTEFGEYAIKVKNAAPDVVYILPQTPTPGVLLVKALKAEGSTAKILTAEVLLIRDAISEQGEILEGVTGIEALFDENRPKARHMLDLYKQEYGLDPTYPGFMAGMYDLIYLIKEAYEARGENPDRIAEYLYNLKDWEGAVGILNFDENGDPTLTYSIRLITGHAAPQVDTYTPTSDR